MITKWDLTEVQKSYIKNLEKIRKTTTNEFALKLIDVFCKKTLSFRDYISSEDSYTLDEIFPKDLYYILDIFMGRNGREDFLEVVRNIREFPY